MKNSTALLTLTLLVALALFSFKKTDPNSYDQEKIVQLALNVETIEKF